MCGAIYLCLLVPPEYVYSWVRVWGKDCGSSALYTSPSHDTADSPDISAWSAGSHAVICTLDQRCKVFVSHVRYTNED